MSYIPDCRTDECYNEKYLDSKNRHVIKGFDWCVEQVVDAYFANFEDTTESDYLSKVFKEELPEYLKQEYQMEDSFSYDNEIRVETRKVETYGDYLRMCLLGSCEMERNGLITSMIDSMDEDELITSMKDSMDEDELKAIKEKVDGRSEEENGQRAPEDGEGAEKAL